MIIQKKKKRGVGGSRVGGVGLGVRIDVNGERRSEVFVKIKKKKNCIWGGGGGGSGWGESGWM